MCVCLWGGHTHLAQHVCGGQGTIYQFFPSTIWIQGLNIGHQAKWQVSVSTEPSQRLLCQLFVTLYFNTYLFTHSFLPCWELALVPYMC